LVAQDIHICNPPAITTTADTTAPLPAEMATKVKAKVAHYRFRRREVTALSEPSFQRDRRRLRVHEAAIGDRIYEIVTTACASGGSGPRSSHGNRHFRCGMAGFCQAWTVDRQPRATGTWAPEKFGAAPAIFGTLVSSAVALIIATPLAIGVAIFLSEFSPAWLQTTDRFSCRSSRRRAERRVRVVGDLRARADAARARDALSARQAASRRNALVLGASVWTEHARRRSGSRNHGAAGHIRGAARGAGGGGGRRGPTRRPRSTRPQKP